MQHDIVFNSSFSNEIELSSSSDGGIEGGFSLFCSILFLFSLSEKIGVFSDLSEFSVLSSDKRLISSGILVLRFVSLHILVYRDWMERDVSMLPFLYSSLLKSPT